jgi:hypothetical protein
VAKGNAILFGLDNKDDAFDLTGVLIHKLDDVSAKYMGKMLLSFIENDFDGFAKMHRVAGENKENFEARMKVLRRDFLAKNIKISDLLRDFIDYVEDAKFPNVFFPENDMHALNNAVMAYEEVSPQYDLSKEMGDWSDEYLIRWAATGGSSLRMNMRSKIDDRAVMDAEDVSYFQGLFKLTASGSGVRRGRKSIALLLWGFLMYIVFSMFR